MKQSMKNFMSMVSDSTLQLIFKKAILIKIHSHNYVIEDSNNRDPPCWLDEVLSQSG